MEARQTGFPVAQGGLVATLNEMVDGSHFGIYTRTQGSADQGGQEGVRLFIPLQSLYYHYNYVVRCWPTSERFNTVVSSDKIDSSYQAGT